MIRVAALDVRNVVAPYVTKEAAIDVKSVAVLNIRSASAHNIQLFLMS